MLVRREESFVQLRAVPQSREYNLDTLSEYLDYAAGDVEMRTGTPVSSIII